ncbi:hypothetical protein TYRP_010032 [Tyrophagus putrescentiae]|nr:hypothetical protein TYRP_010032 [Tyrophagus putrescentiae]
MANAQLFGFCSGDPSRWTLMIGQVASNIAALCSSLLLHSHSAPLFTNSKFPISIWASITSF